MNEIAEQRIDKSTFKHPISGDLIEYSERFTPEERMRLISDASLVHLDFERARFEAFFPDSIPPKPFKEESVDHPPEAGLTPEQRGVRRELLAYLGYTSPSKKQLQEVGDIPGLHVGFTNKRDALVTMMNTEFPSVARMKHIAQTEPSLMLTPQSQLEKGNLEKYSLWHHVNHLGYSFAQTNIRLAIKDPEMYLSRVDADMNEFEHQYKERYGKNIQFDLVPTQEVRELVERTIQNSQLSEEDKSSYFLRSALEHAIEIGKYYEIYTKLHDIESPALKDVFMKTTARTEGQKSVSFSEDEKLITSIHHYLEYELEPIIERHGLQKELLRVIVASLASENSPTLGGYLIKDKRKGLAKRSGYEGIPTGASFDHDQESGTQTNGAFLANVYLPGGFQYKHKDMPEPIGSFEERTRLLTYAIATRMNKADLRDSLKQLSVDPSRVYISAEELSVWPNVVLKKVSLGEGKRSEIMPVSLSPGDVKRGISFQNLLYTFYYFGGQRMATEIFTQDPIAFVLGSGRLPEEAFLYRSDLEITRLLSDISEGFSAVLGDRGLYEGALILSEDEVSTLSGPNGKLANTLITRIDEFPNPILKKDGTLVQDDNGNIMPYLDVIRQKRDKRLQGDVSVHPDSLQQRQDAVTKAVKGQSWYAVIQLNAAKRQELQSFLKDDPKDAIRQTLYFWTKELEIAGKTITPTLRETFFPAETLLVGSSE